MRNRPLIPRFKREYELKFLINLALAARVEWPDATADVDGTAPFTIIPDSKNSKTVSSIEAVSLTMEEQRSVRALLDGLANSLDIASQMLRLFRLLWPSELSVYIETKVLLQHWFLSSPGKFTKDLFLRDRPHHNSHSLHRFFKTYTLNARTLALAAKHTVRVEGHLYSLETSHPWLLTPPLPTTARMRNHMSKVLKLPIRRPLQGTDDLFQQDPAKSKMNFLLLCYLRGRKVDPTLSQHLAYKDCEKESPFTDCVVLSEYKDHCLGCLYRQLEAKTNPRCAFPEAYAAGVEATPDTFEEWLFRGGSDEEWDVTREYFG